MSFVNCPVFFQAVWRMVCRATLAKKYLLADRPEFMEMAPIYEVLDKALAQAQKK
jgi:hypothetical protein